MSVKVGRVLGVPVQIHATWFVVFALLSYAIGRGFVANVHEGISAFTAVGVGALIAAALFGCLIAHELAHAGAARRCGIRTTAIVLSALGGEARMSRDCDSWPDELRIALAGPAASMILAIGFVIPLLLFRENALVTTFAFYLAFANGALGLLNALPGYPMDGGRALRAILWRATGDRTKAARIATGAGELIGLALAVYGAVILLSGDWNGLWFAATGWYVWDAAALEWERERLRAVFERANSGALTAEGALALKD